MSNSSIDNDAPSRLAEAQSQFHPADCYLNTATVGLAADSAVIELQADMTRWQSGHIDALAYDDLIARSRAAYASLVGTTPDRVAILSQVSVATGIAATLLAPGDEVLLAEEDFTSVLFPFLQAEQSGIDVRVVPLARLLEEIRPSTTMVAVSAVQSADGRVIDLDQLAVLAETNNTLTYVDLTQSASWLRADADRFSITTCGAYKWLCCPRGSGFMTVQPAIADRLTPLAAGWYAGEKPWESIYGPPLRLANSARRFDVSPAWAAWVGAAPTLELLDSVGHETIGAHNVSLANRFRAGLEMPKSNSAIVSIELPSSGPTSTDLAAAGVIVAGRAGKSRLSFHLYNTVADVDRALDTLAG
jgi:selenocysteine lyase/cysteine desulfurase